MSEKTTEELSGINIGNAPETVIHAKLERVTEESIFKSICPACKVGLLLVQRDQQTLKLLSEDRCILCGQLYVYADIDGLKKKAGEFEVKQ